MEHGITVDDIENACGDLKCAMETLLENGPNEYDKKNVRDAFGVLEMMFMDLEEENENDQRHRRRGQ